MEHSKYDLFLGPGETHGYTTFPKKLANFEMFGISNGLMVYLEILARMNCTLDLLIDGLGGCVKIQLALKLLK